MKTKAQKLLPYIFLGFLTLGACWLFAGKHGIFGANVDWISQHSVLPGYFRQQFYETGELFPEFAPNLGGGQNIFHFSYYGLYSPAILLSYLLPFIDMGTYLMAASIAQLMLAVWLFYYWLGRKDFPMEIRLFTSMTFLLAGPMIYQSCHQIMFINYMPFLVMALLGVDRHLEEKKSGLYILGVFLMILTSFYFSIGGMLALTLYGFSQYAQQQNGKIRLGRFLKDGFSFLFPMVTAVFMSGVLLVPSAFALLGKREGAKVTDIFNLFIPHMQPESLVYNCYGIGLPTLIITVLLVGLAYRKWQERILTYGCLLILILPFFAWLLNGGLYARSKSLIPFLPIFCCMIAVYLDKQRRREIPFGILTAAHGITFALLHYWHFYKGEMAHHALEWPLIWADAALTFICFLLFWKLNRIHLLALPSVLCLTIFGFISGSFWGLVKPAVYAEITDANIGKLISRTLDEEPQLTRIEQRGPEGEKGADLNRIWDSRQWMSSLYSSAYHADYQKFWKTRFQIEAPFQNSLMQASSNNPLYQKLMGIKYIVKKTDDAKKTGLIGYKPCRTLGKWTIYKNENAAPVAYATDRVISDSSLQGLPFPYNQIALMKYAAVKDALDSGENWKSEIKAWAKPAELSLPRIDNKGIKAFYSNTETYHVQTKEKIDASGEIQGPSDPQNTLLYLQFHVKNNRPSQDLSIWVNGSRNRLSARSHIYYNGNTTFTYVSELEEGSLRVHLTFGAGDYEISHIKCFLGDRRVLETSKDRELYQAQLQADKSQTKGNQILGTIQTDRNGWMVTSIPYDSHFEVYINGKNIKPEKVNTAFLGFAITKGVNHVKIIYHAPGAKAGKILSCAGFLLCIFFLYAGKRQKKYIPVKRRTQTQSGSPR